MKIYEPHPLAKLFPPINGAVLEDLREDIQAKGVIEPIVLHEGMILDGVQRYTVAREAGIEPVKIQFTGLAPNIVNAGPASFVISANLNRRQLTTEERAELGAKLVPMLAEKLGPNGPNKKRGPQTHITKAIKEAAEKLNVSPRSVRRARRKAGQTKPRKSKPKKDKTAGLKPKDSIRKLINRCETNGGAIYVELAGYGIRVTRLSCDPP